MLDIYTPEPGPIRPVTKPGGYIVLYGQTVPFRVYRVGMITAIQPDPGVIVNGGALTTATGSIIGQATDGALGISPGTLAQFRARVMDPIQVDIYEPGQVPLWVAGSHKTQISPLNRVYDPSDHLSEFWVNGNDSNRQVTMDITNPGFFNLAQTRIQCYGFKYAQMGLTEEGHWMLAGGTDPLFKFASFSEVEDWAKTLRLGPTDPAPVLVPVTGWGT